MFKRHYQKRSTNPLFVIFRLCLSLVMFAVLFVGVYTAYKHFSGLDPLKLDPKAIITIVLGEKTSESIFAFFSTNKLTAMIPSQISEKVLGKSIEDSASANTLFSFLLVADSHNDNANLKKAISQAKQMYPDLQFIIGLGDYTDIGTIEELKSAKNEFDLSNLRYFLLVGDHDLWDARDKGLAATANFRQVFGLSYQSFSFKDFRFVLLNNADNYLGIDDNQQEWISEELNKAKADGTKGIFVFVHEPLFHPSSEHVMGRVENKLKLQAKSLSFQLKETGVLKVFAGDIHYFSQYEEPAAKLSMITVGAVGSQRNPQTPRFAVVSVREDGSTKVEDVEIK